jgi:hypothetical protein
VLPLELVSVSSEIGTARFEVLVGCRQSGVQLFLLFVRGAFVQVSVVGEIIVAQTTTTAAARGRAVRGETAAAAAQSHRLGQVGHAKSTFARLLVCRRALASNYTKKKKKWGKMQKFTRHSRFVQKHTRDY